MIDKKFISLEYETPAFHAVLEALDRMPFSLSTRTSSWNVYLAAPRSFIGKLTVELETAFGLKKGVPLHNLSPFRRVLFVEGYANKIVIFHFNYPASQNPEHLLEATLPPDWDDVYCKLKPT